MAARSAALASLVIVFHAVGTCHAVVRRSSVPAPPVHHSKPKTAAASTPHASHKKKAPPGAAQQPGNPRPTSPYVFQPIVQYKMPVPCAKQLATTNDQLQQKSLALEDAHTTLLSMKKKMKKLKKVEDDGKYAGQRVQLAITRNDTHRIQYQEMTKHAAQTVKDQKKTLLGLLKDVEEMSSTKLTEASAKVSKTFETATAKINGMVLATATGTEVVGNAGGQLPVPLGQVKVPYSEESQWPVPEAAAAAEEDPEAVLVPEAGEDAVHALSAGAEVPPETAEAAAAAEASVDIDAPELPAAQAEEAASAGDAVEEELGEDLGPPTLA